MIRAYLSLGANLGDRLAQMAAAVRLLDETPGIRLQAVSGVWETAPWGKVDQPDFLNAVACVETDLEPKALLAAVHRVEQTLGRERTVRWGPRRIDVDILLYGDDRVDLPELTVPHPHMDERAFVLIPLLELLPGRADLRAKLEALPDQGVRPFMGSASFLQTIQRLEYSKPVS